MSGLVRGNWSSTSNSNQLPSSQRWITQADQTGKSENRIFPYDSLCRVDPFDRQLVTGYTQLVADRLDREWTCHLLTAAFVQLPGPRAAVIRAMKDELDRVYSTFLTRTNRKPRAASPDELPILIGAADLPVHKRDRATGPLVPCNGGLHFHNLLLVPPRTRLDVPVERHFLDHEGMYLGRRRLVCHLDVRPVIDGHERVVDYVFKAIIRGRVPYDEGVLLLPKARAELAPARPPRLFDEPTARLLLSKMEND